MRIHYVDIALQHITEFCAYGTTSTAKSKRAPHTSPNFFEKQGMYLERFC